MVKVKDESIFSCLHQYSFSQEIQEMAPQNVSTESSSLKYFLLLKSGQFRLF